MARRLAKVEQEIEEVHFGFSQPQHDFLTATEKYVALVAGFGSGKTHAGLSRIYKNMAEAAAITGGDESLYAHQAYLAPTYPLIRDIFYPAVEKMMDRMGVGYDINQSKHIVELEGLGKIFCRTMDNPKNIIGWEVADAVLDEFDVLPIDKAMVVFRKTSARLRLNNPTGRINQLFITTTPEGFKATYNLFKKNPLKNSKLIQLSTYSNAKNLPSDYIDELMEQYPEALIQAYLMGMFVNLTSGAVYKSYDRVTCRSTESIQPNEPLFIGQDFNVGKMASTIYVKRGEVWHAVGQLKDGFDTPELIETLNEKYSGHHITMYPDASGKNRKSSNASESDLSLLKDEKFSVKAQKKNPFVKDRVNAVNRALAKGFLKVNDALAPDVASNLEQQAYNSNGEPDKTSGNDHHNDATGYPIALEMPIKKPIIINTGIHSAN